MKKTLKNQFHRTIARTVDDIDLFREEFTHFLRITGLDKDILSQVELCAYEIAINVVDHAKVLEAYPSDIDFTCHVNDQKVVCIIYYYSEAFDITRMKKPDIAKHFAEGRNRGLGIYIIKTLMDSVTYAYHEHKNSLTLTKILKHF